MKMLTLNKMSTFLKSTGWYHKGPNDTVKTEILVFHFIEHRSKCCCSKAVATRDGD